jgi:hypothetical protein
MSKILQISLSESDIDRIIDGLCVREKAWQQTAMLPCGEEGIRSRQKMLACQFAVGSQGSEA